MNLAQNPLTAGNGCSNSPPPQSFLHTQSPQPDRTMPSNSPPPQSFLDLNSIPTARRAGHSNTQHLAMHFLHCVMQSRYHPTQPDIQRVYNIQLYPSCKGIHTQHSQARGCTKSVLDSHSQISRVSCSSCTCYTNAHSQTFKVGEVL